MIQHNVRLVVAGVSHTRWTSFEVQQDVRSWPMDWRFTASPVVAEDVRQLCTDVRNAAPVEVDVDGTTVAVGQIVDIERGIDRQRGTYATIAGTGPLGPTTSAAMPLGHDIRGMTIRDAVTSALSPWDIEVIGSNAANRSACTTRTQRVSSPGQSEIHEVDGAGGTRIEATAAEADTSRIITVPDDRAVRARPGESVADWLNRFLRQVGMLCWETATGKVFVGLPDYTMPALFTVVVPATPVLSEPTEGQIVSSKLIEKPGDQATSVTVTGRIGRGGATAISATATDAALVDAGWHSPRIITDDKLRDLAKAQARADQSLRAEQLGSYVYEVTIAGHGVGRFLPAIDTMINVRDEVCEIRETLWCAGRKFVFDRDKGASVQLTLVRPGLWAPESVSE
jgi:prophage tail gpP-like protein